MANTIVKTGNTAPANIRASKSTSSTLLGTIPNGQTVNVVRCDATWATLQFNGTPGLHLEQFIGKSAYYKRCRLVCCGWL